MSKLFCGESRESADAPETLVRVLIFALNKKNDTVGLSAKEAQLRRDLSAFLERPDSLGQKEQGK